MKVLLVSRWLWEERRRNGGKPGFFGELCQAIVAKGVDLTILSQATDAGAVPEPRPADGLNLHVFSRERRQPAFALLDKIVKTWGGYRKAVTDAVVIRQFVRDHGPFDAIVAQCEEPDGLACALASIGGGLPPLMTQVHDLRYEFSERGIRFIRKSSLGFVFTKSARVVANSRQTAAWLQREYGAAREKIGQCRIHLSRPFLSAARQLDPVDPNSRRLLFLGALNRKKAPDDFLRAAILLAPDPAGWTFVLVGPETSDDPAFKATLQELGSHPLLAGRVEWLGLLEPVAVIEQILRARVVVCPSRIETFSRTTIEALALGRPVIVSETTGAAEWVVATGLGSIVPANNPEALAEALAEAIRKWATANTPGFPENILTELTAEHAADDWILEVNSVLR